MKPPEVFDVEIPEGWERIAEHMICIPGPTRFTPKVTICCNSGLFWDYHFGYPHNWVKFDADGCETLEEVCALVHTLWRMV